MSQTTKKNHIRISSLASTAALQRKLHHRSTMSTGKKLQFYLPANEAGGQGGAWTRHTLDLGASREGGEEERDEVRFVRLGDGRTVVTNLLASARQGAAALPPGSIVGRVLKIGHVLLRTRDALSSLLASVETSEDGRLCTPEGWILAGYKVGNQGIVPVGSDSELEKLDPDSGSVLLFYYPSEADVEDAALSRVEEWVSPDLAGWTGGDEPKSSPPRPSPVPRGRSDSYEYDDDDDRDCGWEREEDFTPHSGYYRTGNGDTVWAMQGEGPDYTACDSECGYCGRCSY
jgi:hypothetical protein